MLIDFWPMRYGERLKLAMAYANLNQKVLAEAIGIKQPSLSYLINNENVNGSEKTVKLAVACGVNPQWLDSGEGEMIGSSSTKNKDVQAVLYLMDMLSDEGKSQIRIKMEEWIKSVLSGKHPLEEVSLHDNNLRRR